MEFKRLITRAYWGPVDWNWDIVRVCVLELWVQNTSQYGVHSGEEIARISSLGAPGRGSSYQTDGVWRHMAQHRDKPLCEEGWMISSRALESLKMQISYIQVHPS